MKKAQQREEAILIPKVEEVVTTVHVRGISPLIVHAWSEKAKKQMRDKQMKVATKAKAAKSPEDDFQESRYVDSEGRDCVPARAFKAAVVEAANLMSFKKTDLRKAFFVGEPGQELIPLISAAPTMREDMVRVGMGTADMRYRAEYKEWECKVPVQFNPRAISAEQLFALFDSAGYSVGICEWRPQRNGQFGRFRLVTS